MKEKEERERRLERLAVEVLEGMGCKDGIAVVEVSELLDEEGRVRLEGKCPICCRSFSQIVLMEEE